jgi:hypothetical protein
MSARLASRPTRALETGLLAGLVLGALVLAAALLLGGRVLDALLLGSLAGVLFGPVAARALRGRFDILEPLPLFAAFYGLLFVARPLAMIAGDAFLFDLGGPPLDSRPGFSLMLSAALVGAMGFQLGYLSGLGERIAARFDVRSVSWSTQRSLALASALAAVGLTLFAVFIVQTGGIETVQRLLRGADPANKEELFRTSTAYLYRGTFLLVPAMLIFVAAGMRERRAPLLLVGGALLAIVVVRAAPTGGRLVVLSALASLATLFYLVRRKRPRALVVAGLALVLVLGVTLFREARSPDVTLAEAAATTFTAPGVVGQRLLLGADTSMAPALAAALRHIEIRRGHEWGAATFGDLFLRPVPRLLWKGKPRPPSEEIAAELWGRQAVIDGVNPAFSVLLPFYLDAGLAGAFIGMLGLGIIACLLWAGLNRAQGNPAVTVTYAAALPVLVLGMRDGLTDTLSRAAFLVLPLLLVPLVSRAALPRRRRSEAG